MDIYLRKEEYKNGKREHEITEALFLAIMVDFDISENCFYFPLG